MKKECFYAKKSIQLIERWYQVEINQDIKQFFCGRGFPSGLTVLGGGVDIPHSGREQVQISAIGIATRKSPVVFRAMAEPEKPILVSVGMMLAVADKVKVVPVLGKVINIF